MAANEVFNNNQSEILKVIKNINKSWLKGRIEDLKYYFHKDIIMISPDFKSRLSGIDEIIKSYKDFFCSSKTFIFEESDFHIKIFNDTAAADYFYHIVYKINNKKYDGTGREIWTFSKINNHWLAVWRFLANVVDNEIS